MTKDEIPNEKCSRCGRDNHRASNPDCWNRRACALWQAGYDEGDAGMAVVIIDSALIDRTRSLNRTPEPLPDDLGYMPPFLNEEELTQRFGFPVAAVWAEAESSGTGSCKGIHESQYDRVRGLMTDLRAMLVTPPRVKTDTELAAWARIELTAIRGHLAHAEATIAEIERTGAQEEGGKDSLWNNVTEVADAAALLADRIFAYDMGDGSASDDEDVTP